ncbi:MAG: PD-(D/E)XK nuclease family protein [Streptosporangiaceae bacterium]
MAYWATPAGTAGDIRLIRTNLPAARADPRNCPLARASEARPLLRPDPSPPEAEKPLQDFTLKVFMDALDLVECDGRPVQWVIEQLWSTRGTFGRWRRPPAHHGLLEWTAGVIPRYLAAREADQQSLRLAGLPPTHPVRDKWVAQHRLGQPDSRGAVIYEQTAWGRRYVALDGSMRDLRLLSFGSAKEERPAAEKAAAAYTAACGAPCTGGWDAPNVRVKDGDLHSGRMARPERVRVVEFGCGDGRFTLLLNWDQEETARHFADDTRPVLAEVVDDTRTVPGSSCVDCKALAGCAALIRTEDLLPLSPPARPTARRSISAADLRVYNECPAKFHLTRQLKLTSADPERAEIRRGRAVDAWLNERHLARPAGGCRTLALPENPSAWSAGEWSVSGQEADDGARMLAQHAAVCPLEGLDAGERVLVQPRVACYDPKSDLVIIAAPDLLYTRDGGWVWRETKTSSSRLYEREPLLRSYPQLALAVVMIAAGALGGELSRSRVEFELLHADDLSFEELDPSRPQVVSDAREVLASLARPWAEDSLYQAAPGRHCHGCEALEWCQPGRDHLTASTVPAEDH